MGAGQMLNLKIFPRLLFLFVLQQLTSFVIAQTIQNVTVGVEGSFFSPQTVSAAERDIVNFVFGGDIHSITQSTFENPCTPLPGGFSSNLSGRGRDFSGPTVIFSLTVTNASAPIWYFCSSTRPVSHCNNKMVGVINPPSQAAFMSFANAALTATTTLPFSPAVMLTGIGATATLTTLSDAASPAMTASTNLSALYPPPYSPTPSPTSSPSSSGSHNRGAVTGGAVGAAVGAFLLLCITFLLWRRVKIHRRVSNGSSFFAYNHRPRGARSLFSNGNGPGSPGQMTSTINYNSAHSPNMVTAFDVDHETQQAMSRQPPPQMRSAKTSPMMSEFSMSQSSTSPLQPIRNLSHTNSAGQLTQGSGFSTTGTMYSNNYPSINQQPSSSVPMIAEESPPGLGAATPRNHRPTESSSNTGSDSAGTLDVKAIAREVVNIMREEQKGSSGKGPNAPTGLERSRSTTESLVSAPPKYYTANNTSEDERRI
ncbi:hypothetical protein D9756_007831 [Leucocoprinus leucothites]|uniref:Extracellular serine-rich protein n=1 Tax=Leucocoprinus leucothites TaxID=201217 RepID=A0A8H5D6C1_9AGAR|nr:hypothetical protein D9756_007831 [Leucoagaricus leucothites]